MLTNLYNWIGSLDGFGVDPELSAIFGFVLFLFAVAEFFRLLELIISHLTKR